MLPQTVFAFDVASWSNRKMDAARMMIGAALSETGMSIDSLAAGFPVAIHLR
jgi:hypothetical protein